MPDYVLRVTSRFEAAHHLTSYRGAPEPVHGHSWRIEAVLRADSLGEEGMAYDFVEVKAALDGLTSRFHHRHLNVVAPFDDLSPTTEHLARWLSEQLAEKLPEAEVAEVTVWEGPDCAATYRT